MSIASSQSGCGWYIHMQTGEPNMVLIEGCRGGRSRMTVEKPLIVYKEPNVYTDEIYEIYDL